MLQKHKHRTQNVVPLLAALAVEQRGKLTPLLG